MINEVPRDLWSSWLAFASLWAVVVAQIALLAAATGAVVRRLRGTSPAAMHRAWLLAISLALLVWPVHATLGGWPIAIAIIKSRPTLPEVQSTLPTSPAPTIAQLQIDEQIQTEVAAQLANDDVAAQSRTNLDPPRAEQPSAPFASADQPWLFGMQSLVAIYIGGVLWISLRTVIATWQLMHWARKGRRISPCQPLIQAACRQLGLATAPEIVSHSQVSMPLMFGIAKPVVLVPSDFLQWPSAEQRCVLLHELAHIQRRDTWSQLASVALRCVYWLHPACWYLDRQQSRWRELATDQRVIDSGMSSCEYATCLLNILQRAQSQHPSAAMAIGMSCSTDVSQRIAQIVDQTHRSSPSRVLSAAVALGLVAVLAATTFQIKWLPASNEQPPTTPETNTAATNQIGLAPGTPIDQSDFQQLLQGCELATPEDMPLPPSLKVAIASIKGQVRDSAGQPVAGALVILNSDYLTFAPELNGERFDKWFDFVQAKKKTATAKTITDDQGNYKFEDVPYPAHQFPTPSAAAVIASHPQLGSDWRQVRVTLDAGFKLENVNLTLSKSDKLEGTVIRPDGRPLAGATVTVIKLRRYEAMREPSLPASWQLHSSQLAPQSLTDAEGRFRFQNMPTNCTVTIRIRHPDSADTFAELSLYNEMESIPALLRHQASPKILLDKPFRIESDPGYELIGKVVDNLRQPVAGAVIYFASTQTPTTSAADGSFRIRFRSSFKRVALMSDLSRSLTVRPPQGSELLDGGIILSSEELKDPDEVVIQLHKVVTVVGRIVTPAGISVGELKPIVRLFDLKAPDRVRLAEVADDGTFKIQIGQSRYRVLVGTSVPGFRLPYSDFLMLSPEKLELRQLAGPEIDTSASPPDGQSQTLEPIVVERIPPLEIVVSMPDGQPATSAEVRFASASGQVRSHLGLLGVVIIPPDVYSKTDERGRAELTLHKDAGLDDIIEVRLTRGDENYRAIAHPSTGRNRIAVQLQREM